MHTAVCVCAYYHNYCNSYPVERPCLLYFSCSISFSPKILKLIGDVRSHDLKRDTLYARRVGDDRSRRRRLGEHAKLIRRGVSALSCGTQPPRGLRCRRLSNFLHCRPDVQFIARHEYTAPPIFARRKTHDRSRKDRRSCNCNLDTRHARHT